MSDSGCRQRLISFIAYALAISFIVALPVSIIAHNAIRILFSSDALSEAVTELVLLRGGIREQLLDETFTSDWLDNLTSDRGNPFEFLTPQDRLRITQNLFPDAWIENQVQDGFETILAWIETDQSAPEIHLDFVPVKESLSEGGSKIIVAILVNSWPDCIRNQELTMRRALDNDLRMKFELCRPSDDTYALLVDRLDSLLLEYVGRIQSETSFLGDTGDDSFLRSLNNFKSQLLRLSLWLRWLRLFPLPMIGLLMALTIRSWSELGRWWGIPLMIGSLLGLLIIVLIQTNGPDLVNRALVDSGDQVIEVDALRNVIWSVFQRIFRGAGAHMLLTFIMGAGLFGTPWVLSRRQESPVSPSLPATEGQSTEMVEETPLSDSARVRGIPLPPPVKPFDPEELSDENKDKPIGTIK